MGRRRDRDKKGTPHRAARVASPRAPVSAIAIAVAALFVVASALAHPPASATAFWLKTGTIVAIASSLVAILPLRVITELPERCAAALRRPSPLMFAALVTVVALGLSVVFAFYLFDRWPLNSDEIAQLWHAKMLVHGRLALPADPNPEFFAIDNVIDTGRWYSEYPIGGPAVLAIGVLIGSPWLVNPVLAGLSALAMYHFGRRAYGETQGRAIAALFSVTPMVLMMSGSYMNHVPVLFLATCTLAALVEWERAVTPRRAMLLAAVMGIAIGAIATIRPLDAVVVAIVVGIFQLTIIARDRPRIRELAVQAVAGAIAVAPLLYANWATTGSPLRFGYEVLWGAGHNVGFHADPQGGVHTLGRALHYAVLYVSELNLYLMLWPVPALLIAIAGLLSFKRVTRWDALLLGLFWAQVVAYASYWYSGQYLGPRFLFTALPTIIVLLARTPFLIGDRFSGFPRRAGLVLMLACVIVSWTTPKASLSVWESADQVRTRRGVLKVDIAAIVDSAGVHHALVIVREPFGSQMVHRMWGIGVSRSRAAQLLATRDACSLLAALRAAELDSVTPRDQKADMIERAAEPYVPADPEVRTGDPALHISSAATLTAPCRAELDDDVKLGVGTFGPALLLEPVNAEGRIDGDVIYAVDLGERNAVLRARFGDRTWYRLSVMKPGSSVPRPVLTPY